MSSQLASLEPLCLSSALPSVLLEACRAVTARATCSSRAALMLQPLLVTDATGQDPVPGKLAWKDSSDGAAHGVWRRAHAWAALSNCSRMSFPLHPFGSLLGCPFFVHSWHTYVTDDLVSATSLCLALFHPKGQGTMWWICCRCTGVTLPPALLRISSVGTHREWLLHQIIPWDAGEHW